jgi:crossover junction endodeoxyribonuclease RuvC
MGKIYVGIDPGLKGGIAVITEGILTSLLPMPGEAGLREFLQSLSEAGKTIPPMVVLEKSQPMPKQGVSSVFSYGVGYGIILGMLIYGRIPYHLVRPAVWKSTMLAGEPDKKDKGTSIRVVERIFPDVELVPRGCRKPADGLAEALLMAEYGRRLSL